MNNMPIDQDSQQQQFQLPSGILTTEGGADGSPADLKCTSVRPIAIDCGLPIAAAATSGRLPTTAVNGQQLSAATTHAE